MRTISLQTARRLFIQRQHLNELNPANDAAGILDVVRDLGCLQLDPISAVARSHQLVVRSRVGHYDLAALDQLLWTDRSLFEYWAHVASIVLTEDYPIHALLMRTYAREESTGEISQRYKRWLAANQKLRRHILQELKQRGPLPSRVFENQTEKEAGWYSSGWTSGRDVSQMLDYLWTTGKIMVAGRSGIQKLWDLSERCLPEWTPRERLSEKEVVRRASQKALRALGVATPQHINLHYTRRRYPHLNDRLRELMAEGVIERVSVENQKGDWYLHAADVPLLDRVEKNEFAFERTTLLSPFDNLICDRARTRQLFNFDFTIEIYVPAHKRQYGYYVLPILHGDRLIGRIDPKMDREHDRLHIHAVHAEKDAPLNRKTARAIRDAIEDLATFLGATEIHYTHLVPSSWQRDLK
ncbi:MAG TPA: crosslink repair DNA glycosylase YcaQ family protein [Anaerolineae bacterium]|nr:crosslink repair DNA glycosylase YcaQ family protein [Anaerolineae bacterium]